MTSISISRNVWHATGSTNASSSSSSRQWGTLAQNNDNDLDLGSSDTDHFVKKEIMSVDKPEYSQPGEPTGIHSSPISNLSKVTDIESTMDLYVNVELGVVADIQERDKFLKSLAQVKRSVAETERKLAMFRKKEVSIIQRLHTVLGNLAQKRQLQADLNIDRLGYFFRESQRSREGVNVGSMLSDIVTTLSRPTEPIL